MQSRVTAVDTHTLHSTTLLRLFRENKKRKTHTENRQIPASKNFPDHTNSLKISLVKVSVFPVNFTIAISCRLSSKGVALSQHNRAFLLVNVDSVTVVCSMGTTPASTFYIL